MIFNFSYDHLGQRILKNDNSTDPLGILWGQSVNCELRRSSHYENISAIADGAHSGRDQSFGYDIKDQLTSASGYYGSFAWTYDKLGNRTLQTISNG